VLYYKTFELSPTHEWVVFVHGAGGSSSIWFKQLRDFKKHFNVLLLDLRGHGQSQQEGGKPIQRYTFNEISQEILEVLDHARVESAHFVGISLGTVLIRNLHDLAPQRLKSMILGGAVMRLNYRARVLSLLGDWFKTALPYMWIYKLVAWIIMPKKRHKKSRTLFVNEAKKLCQNEFIRWYQLSYEINSLLKCFTDTNHSVPVLYLMGDDDYMFLPYVRKLVAKQNLSHLVVIRNSGHVCNVDQPEVFNRQAIEFIEGLKHGN